jgi:hypothetical protein
LSTFGRRTPESGIVEPDSTIARVSSEVSAADRPFRYAAIRKAAA